MHSQGVLGQFKRSAVPLHIRRAPAHVLVAFAWLSVWCGGVRVLSSISPLSSMVFSIELTVQCDGCLMWGVGQAYGVFHQPGFGLLVSVPRFLSTQPPFVTQPLINIIIH